MPLGPWTPLVIVRITGGFCCLVAVLKTTMRLFSLSLTKSSLLFFLSDSASFCAPMEPSALGAVIFPAALLEAAGTEDTGGTGSAELAPLQPARGAATMEASEIPMPARRAKARVCFLGNPLSNRSAGMHRAYPPASRGTTKFLEFSTKLQNGGATREPRSRAAGAYKPNAPAAASRVSD